MRDQNRHNIEIYHTGSPQCSGLWEACHPCSGDWDRLLGFSQEMIEWYGWRPSGRNKERSSGPLDCCVQCQIEEVQRKTKKKNVLQKEYVPFFL